MTASRQGPVRIGCGIKERTVKKRGKKDHKKYKNLIHKQFSNLKKTD
jgi:hypothetical protein